MRATAKFDVPLGIVVVTALLGLSFARVNPSTETTAWILTLGGAVAGVLAVGLVYLLRPDRPLPALAPGPRRLLGIRVMICGLLIAMVGWLLAVFVSFTLGYVVAAIGILTGVVGMIVHIVLLSYPK